MSKNRSESDVIAQAPLTIVLGGKKHKVRILAIKDSREWRKKIVDLWAQLPGQLSVTTDDPKEFEKALSSLLVKMPDVVVDLFFLYAKDLKRKEVEAVATDSEIAKGFEQVVEVAFPLARSMVKTMERLSQ